MGQIEEIREFFDRFFRTNNIMCEVLETSMFNRHTIVYNIDDDNYLTIILKNNELSITPHIKTPVIKQKIEKLLSNMVMVNE